MSPPHNPPALIIDNTHRAILLPPEFAEHLQVEPDTPIVFTGAEVKFSFFLGGVFVVVAEVVASFIWSFA